MSSFVFNVEVLNDFSLDVFKNAYNFNISKMFFMVFSAGTYLTLL